MIEGLVVSFLCSPRIAEDSSSTRIPSHRGHGWSPTSPGQAACSNSPRTLDSILYEHTKSIQLNINKPKKENNRLVRYLCPMENPYFNPARELSKNFLTVIWSKMVVISPFIGWMSSQKGLRNRKNTVDFGVPNI